MVRLSIAQCLKNAFAWLSTQTPRVIALYLMVAVLFGWLERVQREAIEILRTTKMTSPRSVPAFFPGRPRFGNVSSADGASQTARTISGARSGACIQGGSRPERCTEGVKKRDDDRRHREAAYGLFGRDNAPRGVRERLVPPASRSRLAGKNPRRVAPHSGEGRRHQRSSRPAGGSSADRPSPSCDGYCSM